MQLSRFDCWVTKEQSRDQEVVPGAQQLLVLQQSFFIARQDLRWKRMYLGNAWSQGHCKDRRQKRPLTLQMTSRCLLLEKELSCRQWSTSSCHRLHLTWKSVNVCAPPGWRKTAECSDVKNHQLCFNRLPDLCKCYLWTNQQIQLHKQILSAVKNGQIKVENHTL